jgi:glucose/arabinose dehydrogenase
MVASGDDLYLTVGDYNQDNVLMHSRLEAQNPDSDFGKILRIDLRTGAKTLISMGHRNPQGLVITSKGAMYATEHGPRGGDELNLIVPGKNYGWPVTTLGTHYTTYDWASRDEGGQPFESPVFAWLPSIGVSHLIEVVGFHPLWDNDLLVTSLKAQTVYRLRLDGDRRVLYSEPITLGQRLRDIVVLPDRTLAIWTDEAQLMFLSVDGARLASNRRAVQ